MGTRGWFVYKWQGKYYVYFNRLDSSPSGLGRNIIITIPSEPEQYQAWLQRMRSRYSTIAKQFERVFTISMDEFGAVPGHKDPHPEEDNLERLEQLPGYLTPERDGMVEWIYIVDLDRELFGIQNVCYYHLSKVTTDFEDTMEDAQRYWLGYLGRNEIHESIATNDIHLTPLTDDPTPVFLQMQPTTIYPKQESSLNRMPTFVACKRVYRLFLSKYEKHIRQAQDSHTESDFLFRELVFAIMCFTSCSPEWVRLIAAANIKYEGDGRNNWRYGAVLDHSADRRPKEFMTRFLQGYHLEGLESGSAPTSTSYWFSGALVYLKRDITSRERFRDAIVSAVAKGKADGRTHFSAIVVSLKHFILLKFSDGNVQHTKRLNLGACPEVMRERALMFYHEIEEQPNKRAKEFVAEEEEKKKNTNESREPTRNSSELETTADNNGLQHDSGDASLPSSNETTHGPPDDSDWADNSNAAAFGILAHFFDATEKQELKPSTIYNEGVLPNEVYQNILRYVDLETNIACRKVSRSFREWALETFVMDNGLKLVYRPRKEPECFHDNIGFIGPFNPVFYKKLLRSRNGDIPYGIEDRLSVSFTDMGEHEQASTIEGLMP
ncbi:hypothetical protein F5Y10DRAFT_291013 [Nemania abortiva]|nr:hypothetical protein F5Y10DRAFT_291013 [Nemania abortiva]